MANEGKNNRQNFLNYFLKFFFNIDFAPILKFSILQPERAPGINPTIEKIENLPPIFSLCSIKYNFSFS